jgi:hypothetical protein
MRSNSNHSENRKNMKLDAIVTYEMDEMEAKAYKLMLLWHQLSHKYFPDVNRGNSYKGDPRKSMAFKICYKLVRETFTYLEEKDYPLYVRAQLEVLKHISTQQNTNVLIDPNCLVGNQAWKRWLLWKNRYEKKLKKPEQNQQKSQIGETKAIQGLRTTKDFMVKNFGINYKAQHLEVRKKDIINWINFGKISPYYIVLSPVMKELLSPSDLEKINFDSKFYEECITTAVRAVYNATFKEEVSIGEK